MLFPIFIQAWVVGMLILAAWWMLSGQRFYTAHRARYRTWRSDYVETGRLLSWESYRQARTAWSKPLDDSQVERLRRRARRTFVLLALWLYGFPLVVGGVAIVAAWLRPN